MLKKFISAFMLFTLCLVQANAASQNNLKAAFDSLNYSLTVEWDQKDKAFYAQQMTKFSDTIKELQAEGLTNQELIEFSISQVKDQKLANDLRTLFTMITINKMNGAEAHKYVTDMMGKSYARGASWGGEVVIGVVLILAIVAAVALASGNARVTDQCAQYYSCDTHCAGDLCYDDCGYKCI